ncbi:MAG TPA: PIG-L family deacetylase [Rhodothermia bacterium]|nr:PIG-L family deacetylase [Rhodothermia bacterium]
MKFSQPRADIYVPSAEFAPEKALARTTHLCIAAHQDDIEIMAYEGITACLGQSEKSFTGVVVTDGAGSPRSGSYANLSDEQMKEVRRHEQRRAAKLGKFGLCVQLAHPSSVVKDPRTGSVRDDLETIVAGCRPAVVYLHNPADKHDTHIAVLHRSLEALRAIPAAARPKKVLGCEVWRDLDWLPDDEKIALDASERPELAMELLAAFDSQISGGKRYDMATIGRRVANATFHTSHRPDSLSAITWAMDLTPLVSNSGMSVEDYTIASIDRFRADVQSRLQRFAR